MKKRFIVILLLGGLLHLSCSDWLDVKPRTETRKAELFESQKGFRDALTGTYIRMKGGNVYGDALMWGNIEFMAQHWDLPTANASSARANLKRYDYNNGTVQEWMANMYEGLYKVIADANSILEEIDAKKSVFEAGNYEMIKGEALALRAFCHFDVLRLFGPIPTEATENKILPYVKMVVNQPHEHATYQQFVRFILDDLNMAEALLKEVDPILEHSIRDLNTLAQSGGAVGDDTYVGYRQLRMNYYAVLAQKARVNLWIQEKGEAGRYAKMVIDAVDKEGAKMFRLGNQSDITAGDYTVSSEHIMALLMHNLRENAVALFGQSGSLMKQDYDYYLGQLFPAGERTTDIRFALWIPRNLDTTYKLFRKFIQSEGYYPILQAPLLRLSEMYLIATETADNLTEASNFYKTFCVAKGIPFTQFADEADRSSKLIREYNREFYAEGQAFFAFKRRNERSILWATVAGGSAVYIVPMPIREIEYYNK